MGKNLRDDLREGKATLPLIIAMQRASACEQQLIRHAIESGNTSDMDQIIAIVQRTGSLLATREAAASEAQRALDALAKLPLSPYRDALEGLASELLTRRA
jgi:octaprenyl-diphosphate synthase